MMAWRSKGLLFSICVAIVAVACTTHPERGRTSGATGGWSVYGGNQAAQRYSPLTQITRTNVRSLRQVWQFNSAEPGDPETNPLVVGGRLFAFTPALEVVCLDAATGKQLWQFDSGLHVFGPSRGLTYWSDGHSARVFAGVANLLFALDAATGQPVEQFAENGHIDL